MSGTEKSTDPAVIPSTNEVSARRELMINAARQFDEARRRFRDCDAESDALMVVPLDMWKETADPRTFLPRLVEGIVRTNLQLAKEVLLADSPAAHARLQQRFAREYFAAFHQGIAALIHAASRSTELRASI